MLTSSSLSSEDSSDSNQSNGNQLKKDIKRKLEIIQKCLEDLFTEFHLYESDLPRLTELFIGKELPNDHNKPYVKHFLRIQESKIKISELLGNAEISDSLIGKMLQESTSRAGKKNEDYLRLKNKKIEDFTVVKLIIRFINFIKNLKNSINQLTEKYLMAGNIITYLGVDNHPMESLIACYVNRLLKNVDIEVPVDHASKKASLALINQTSTIEKTVTSLAYRQGGRNCLKKRSDRGAIPSSYGARLNATIDCQLDNFGEFAVTATAKSCQDPSLSPQNLSTVDRVASDASTTILPQYSPKAVLPIETFAVLTAGLLAGIKLSNGGGC